MGEVVYNRLHIGQSATFQLRGENAAHAGRIISLTGVSAAPANFAIQPSVMAKEPYRVTVKLTALDQHTSARSGGLAASRLANEPQRQYPD